LLALLLAMCMVMVVACSSSDGSDGSGGDGTTASVVPPGIGGTKVTDPGTTGGPIGSPAGTDAGGKFLVKLLVRDAAQRTGRKLAEAYRLAHPGSLVQLTIDGGLGIQSRLAAGEQPDVILDNRKNLNNLSQSNALSWRPQEFGTDVYSIAVAKGNPKGINSLKVFDNDPAVVTGLCPTTKNCGKDAVAILLRAGITSPPDKVLTGASDIIRSLSNKSIDAAILTSVKIGNRAKEADAIRLPSTLKTIVTHWQMSSVSGSAAADSFTSFMFSAAGAAVLQESGLLPIVQ
jgi:molybdate transport system substrate-binding protein